MLKAPLVRYLAREHIMLKYERIGVKSRGGSYCGARLRAVVSVAHGGGAEESGRCTGLSWCAGVFTLICLGFPLGCVSSEARGYRNQTGLAIENTVNGSDTWNVFQIFAARRGEPQGRFRALSTAGSIA